MESKGLGSNFPAPLVLHISLDCYLNVEDIDSILSITALYAIKYSGPLFRGQDAELRVNRPEQRPDRHFIPDSRNQIVLANT